MMRNILESNYLLLMGAVILFATLFTAGCGTTFLEYSGRMPNENTSRHVKGYQMGNSESEAVRPVTPLPALR